MSDNSNFKLSPYEIDLLCDTLSRFICFSDTFASFLDVEEPSKRHDDLVYLRDRLFDVRRANDRTNCGYYTLEIVRKWHSEID